MVLTAAILLLLLVPLGGISISRWIRNLQTIDVTSGTLWIVLKHHKSTTEVSKKSWYMFRNGDADQVTLSLNTTESDVPPFVVIGLYQLV